MSPFSKKQETLNTKQEQDEHPLSKEKSFEEHIKNMTPGDRYNRFLKLDELNVDWATTNELEELADAGINPVDLVNKEIITTPAFDGDHLRGNDERKIFDELEMSITEGSKGEPAAKFKLAQPFNRFIEKWDHPEMLDTEDYKKLWSSTRTPEGRSNYDALADRFLFGNPHVEGNVYEHSLEACLAVFAVPIIVKEEHKLGDIGISTLEDNQAPQPLKDYILERIEGFVSSPEKSGLTAKEAEKLDLFARGIRNKYGHRKERVPR